MYLLLGAVLALPMGLVLGALGGGGSVLTVPILVYGLGMAAKEAIATSLVVVGVTAAVGAGQQARQGLVCWTTTAAFAPGAMLGAYLGGRAAGFIPGDILLALFGIMMLVTAVLMLRKSLRFKATKRAESNAPESDNVAQSDLPQAIEAGTTSGDSSPSKRSAPTGIKRAVIIGVEGILVGALTGLVGAGGGFLVVPALMWLARLPIKQAVATSLAIIALKSVTGVMGHLAHVDVQVGLTAIVTLAAITGVVVGGKLSSKVSGNNLQRAFAVLVLVMGTWIIVPPLL